MRLPYTWGRRIATSLVTLLRANNISPLAESYYHYTAAIRLYPHLLL